MRFVTIRHLALLAALAGVCSCARLPIDVIPDSQNSFQELTVKFNFKSRTEKQNGKMIVKIKDQQSKMLFVSPLNRIYFELSANGERVWLYNLIHKTVWQGEFHILLDELWAIDLNLADLLQLLRTGQKPAASEQQVIAVEFAANGLQPQRIVCTQADRSLELKIVSHDIKSGLLQFRTPAGFLPVELADVLDI